MRISFLVAAADLSGGARVIHTYADLLARRGHDVHVVVRPPARPSTGAQLRSLVRQGCTIPFHPRPDTHITGIGYRLKFLDRFRSIRSGDIPDSDVIIATWWRTAEWLGDMPANKGAKIHFVQGYESFSYTDMDRVHAALQLPFPKITISSWLKSTLMDQLGVDDVHLVSNGVDMTLFDAQSRDRQACPTVGMLFSPLHEKNCSIGLAAVECVQNRIPGLQLLLIDPTMTAHSLPMGTRRFSRVDQEYLREIYSGCDVWLWPSRQEGFGLPILEAMACRTPVVATNAGAATDLITDGVNGHIVNDYGAEAIAEGLMRVFDTTNARWRMMSEAAYEIARGHNWEAATKRFERVLTDVAVRHRPNEKTEVA